MDTIVLPLSLYDIFLDAVQFDSPEEVLQRVEYHLRRGPEHSVEAKHALSHLLAPIVTFRKHDLLELLFETLLENGITVHATAVKAAVALPLPFAAVYFDKLFALGWDVNTALSNSEPPVSSYVCSNTTGCWVN